MSIPENHYVVVSEDSIEVIDGDTFMDRSVPEVKKAIDNVSWDALFEEADEENLQDWLSD